MNGISSKITGGALASSLVGIATWIISLYGINVPAGVAVYGATILAFIVGWFVPETATGSNDVITSPYATKIVTETLPGPVSTAPVPSNPITVPLPGTPNYNTES